MVMIAWLPSKWYIVCIGVFCDVSFECIDNLSQRRSVIIIVTNNIRRDRLVACPYGLWFIGTPHEGVPTVSYIIICIPYTQYQYHMDMIWHQDIFVYFYVFSIGFYILYFYFAMSPDITQYHLSIHNLAKIMCTILRTYRHKISTWRGIIISFFAWRFTWFYGHRKYILIWCGITRYKNICSYFQGSRVSTSLQLVLFLEDVLEYFYHIYG